MRLLTICGALLLVTACSIEERGAPGTNPETKLDLSSAIDSVSVTLSAPETARRGDDVPVVISIRNTTTRTLDLALAGREIAFDIVVTHNETVVWQRLYGKTIPAILQLKKLLPSEAFELTDVWHANVAPGDYRIGGKVLTDAQPLEAEPRTIKIQ